MAQYIDKDALVAEIESYKNSFCDRNGYLEDSETNGLAYDTLCELEDSIEALEVKEVDLDAEWVKYFENRGDMETVNVKHLAKHFFELGLAASNKAQKGEQV